MINFLLRAMDERGCRLPATFVACVPDADLPVLGGFDMDSGRVLLNSAQVRDQKTATRTILHELIHAYDACRVHLDADSCRHLACTEVRAANLSDDCSFSAELGRGNLSFRAGQKKCVHRRAALSIRDAPACHGLAPEQVVGSVFRRCYRDTAPFPGVPE
jgi:inner membrane protease ATP23